MDPKLRRDPQHPPTRRSPAPPPQENVDGYIRSGEAERKLNEAVGIIFKGPAGELVMDYLKSITINTIAGPAASDAELRHLEGARWLVAVLIRRQVLAREGR
jgi:hypothetical protein